MHTISSLPLPSSSQLLTHNLTPDPLIKSEAILRNEILPLKPSIQRRARLLAPEAHFSYVTPFPQPFPYEISAPDPPEEVQDKAAYVENWLSQREAKHASPKDQTTNGLVKYYRSDSTEDLPRNLIGLSSTGLRDCLSDLDTGNANDVVSHNGQPSLLVTDDGSQYREDVKPDAACEDLIEILGGKAVLMSTDQSNTAFAPWSLRYSGHQFGSWAGQLGDGRAISIRT